MNNALELRNVHKSFNDFHLEDISLHLPRGYILGLLGPNGAGKSTTIKLLLNLLKPDSGEIQILGRSYTHSETLIKQKIGYVGENQNFYQDLTIDWTVNFISRFYKIWNQEKLNGMLTNFGLKRQKQLKDLSKGQKVLFNISLALAHEPELLILDEPTSGLDPIARKEIMDILLDMLQDENKAILFSSHITEDVEQIADYVAIIIKGKLALFDTKEAILDSFRKVSIPESTGKTLGSTLITNTQTLSEYKGMHSQPASLEEILISLVKEANR